MGILKPLFRLGVLSAAFLLLFAMTSAAVVLVSAGLLAIPVALAVMTGVFTSVASDLSPPSMLLAGISCLSAGLALALAVIVLFPKQTKIFKKKP
ncbi:MAG: hypothetical protein LBI38_04600 [Oscillospiraceae bacterium]|jgi:hypothetical protein|nr:hypothetical protein [Oscillospiraceae bacterium]